MIRLNLKREPYWIDLPAKVRIYVRPISTAIMSAAQSKVIKEVALKQKDSNNNNSKENLSNETEQLGITESLLIKSLARISIIKWEGVLKADSNRHADVTAKNIDDLMDIWFIAQEFWKTYTDSFSLLEAEGKSLKKDAAGTLEEEAVTAKPVRSQASHAAKVKKAS